MACKLKLKGKELDKQTLTNILQQLGNNQDFKNALIYDNYIRLTSEEANVTADAKDFLKDMFNLNSIDEVNDSIRTEEARRRSQGVGTKYSRWTGIAGKTANTLSKVGRGAKKLFLSNKGPFAFLGDYSAPLFKAFIKRDGEISVWLSKANRLTEAFQKQIDNLDKYISDADKIAFSNILKNKNGLADKNWDSIPFTKLEGNPRADEIKKSIRAKLEPVIKQMRDHIDEGTKFILNIPGLTNKVQADIFLDNLGKYTTVLYEVHRNEDWFQGFKSDKDSGEILDPKKREIFNAAIPHVRNYLAYEANLLNKLKNKKLKSIATISSSTAPLTSQQASVIDKLKKDISTIDNRLIEINGALTDVDLLKIEVVNELESMYKGTPLTNMSAGGYRGAMSKDIFRKRKNIPREIKDLFGEIKEPENVYLYTIAKMAAVAANAEFQLKMFEINEQMLKGYKNNPKKAIPPLFSTQKLIDADVTKKVTLSDAYSVLTGMLGTNEVYMTEDMAEFFESEMTGNKINPALETLMGFNAAAKIMATVANLPTQFKNFYANFGKVLFSYAVSPHKKEITNYTYKVFQSIQLNKNPELGESLLNEMRRQGLIGSELTLADIRKNLEAAPWVEDIFGKGGAFEQIDRGLISRPLRAAKNLIFYTYQGADDIAKIALFITEAVNHSHIYAKNGDGSTYEDLLKNGSPELIQRIHDMSGNKTAGTIPVYSQALNITKALQKWGVTITNGPFSIFRFEQLRVLFTTFSIIKKEILNQDPNPKIRRKVKKMGWNRLIGMSLLLGVSTNLVLNLLFGDYEEEEEKFISKWGYIPDYMESPILNKRNNNTFEVMDGASVNIFGSVGLIDKALKDVMSGAKEPSEAIGGVISKIFEPIWTPQIGTATLINAAKGLDQWGDELFNDADTYYEKVFKSLEYAMQPMIPGTVTSYFRIGQKEVKMENYLKELKRLHNEGQEQELIDFQKEAYLMAKQKYENEKIAFAPGVRFNVINPNVELPSKVYDIWGAIKDVKPKFKDDVNDVKNRVISNKELIDKYKEVRRIYFDNLSKLREFYKDSKAAGFDVERPLTYGNLAGGINKIELDKPILSGKELEYIMGKTNVKPDLVIQDFDKELGIERDKKTGECLNCQEAFSEAIRKDKNK